MSRSGAILVVLLGVAVANSVFAIAYLLLLSGHVPQGALHAGQGLAAGGTTSQPELLLLVAVRFLLVHSLALAPASWLLVGGVWVWRGRIKAMWEGLGFDSDVFKLFMKMRGGKSRFRMMNALTKPKARNQLSEELDMDWRAVDQHLGVLARHGLVGDDAVYGKIRVYYLTISGRRLLELLEDIDLAEKTPEIHQTN